MKIQASIREIYTARRDHFDMLKEHVDPLLVDLKPNYWHFESRVKTLESFALKLETGRIESPDNLEDFFGALIVVRNSTELSHAQNLISKKFEIIEVRPTSKVKSKQFSSSFQFDDIRLFVSWKDNEALRPTGLDGTLFEIQLKTYLQHAWAIATHDLIYKTDEINWSKERIAFQIKAMLEHAEASIQQAGELSKVEFLQRDNAIIDEQNSIVGLINKVWEPDQLPNDLKRLVENISMVLFKFKLSVIELSEIMESSFKGTVPLNLSPYSAMLRALYEADNEKFIKVLKDKRSRGKLLLTRELDLPNLEDLTDSVGGVTII